MSDDTFQAPPALSLVVSTKGRSSELTSLLQSLARQTLRDFELIIVEQNPEPLLGNILKQQWPFRISHIHTPGEQGASRGRNRGRAKACAEYLLFPDDDCWYPPDFLERGLAQLREFDLDALTGRPTTENGETINGRYEAEAQRIDRSNVWTTQMEWIAFWRRAMLDRVDGFDEDIGVGATTPWQSAEGQDLMLRVLRAGGHCRYDPTLNGHDAGVDPRDADDAFIARARAYGRGMGYVIRKHRLGVKVPARFLVRALGGSVIAAARGRMSLARFYAATALGRAEGLLGRCLDG